MTSHETACRPNPLADIIGIVIIVTSHAINQHGEQKGEQSVLHDKLID
jgi:hypothetical protein